MNLLTDTNSSPGVEEPTLRIDSEGVIQDANNAALELLGLSIDDVRALPPGALAAEPTDPEEDAALRRQWETAGRDGLVGLTTILRPDGQRVRVAFAIYPEEDAGFTATITRHAGPVTAPSKVYTVGDVLGMWRAAERRLESVDRSTPAYEAVLAEIEDLRTQYQRLFEARQRAS